MQGARQPSSIVYIHQNTGLALSAVQQARLTDGTRVLLADDSQLLAVFVLQDAIREEAESLINSLHRSNVQTLLFSGDDETAVSIVAGQLHISEYQSSMLPADKLHHLQILPGKS